MIPIKSNSKARSIKPATRYRKVGCYGVVELDLKDKHATMIRFDEERWQRYQLALLEHGGRKNTQAAINSMLQTSLWNSYRIEI